MDWDKAAEGWDSQEGVKDYAASALTGLKELDLKFARVLDFGCGSGLLSELMIKEWPTIEITAVDISSKMIEVCKGKNLPNVSARQIDSPTDLESDGVFDLIVCSSVLGFVPDYESYVSQLAKRLGANGSLVHWDWQSEQFTKEKIGAVFAKNSLDLKKCETAFEFHGMDPVIVWGKKLDK